ncbi:hypothetical protein [Bernardetia litoralis]|nr:hypothetical protein [Bernardetia litoralis]
MTTFLKNPFLIWIFSLLFHSLLLVLVYSVFWASYGKTTLDFLYHFANQINTDSFAFVSWFLIASLGFSFSAVFAQLFISLFELNQNIRILILYILVFFVAFVPMLLWLDQHVVASICTLSGVSLLIANFRKNTDFYVNTFIGSLLCLMGLFWSIKGFGWAMASSIPFSVWYLKKEHFKNQIPQVVILVSFVMLALVWDFLQNEKKEDKIIHFSATKIKKNIPELLLDEHLMEVNWSKNDFNLWLNNFTELNLIENNDTNKNFTDKSIQEITDFLLYYDSISPTEGNPILEFHFIFLQIALLIFWFLFLGNYNLSRYRLITYWSVFFLIWLWTKYIILDTENGFLLALCAYGGLLPLIGANQFKDIVSFKIHQKIIFIAIIILIIVELSGSLAVYISKSLDTRQSYVEAKAVLEKIYQDSSSEQRIYIDWNSKLNNKTSLPFLPSILTQLNQKKSQNNIIIPNTNSKKNTTNISNLSTLYFILPSKTSKSQTDMLTLYFSEHQEKLIKWKLIWETETIEVWELIIL